MNTRTFALGFACGALLAPAILAAILISEPIEDVAMQFLNSALIERMWE